MQKPHGVRTHRSHVDYVSGAKHTRAVQARLKVLDLSDNALGEKGVRACAAALSSQVMPRPIVRLQQVSSCSFRT